MAAAVLSALGPTGPVKHLPPHPHRRLHPDPGPGPSPPHTRDGEGPVVVPLDVPEDALPLPHLPPHLPHPHHLVPEAGPVPHLPAGEVTGDGGTALTDHMTITKGRECCRRSVQ